VYYGPEGSGKSTALGYLYSRIKPSLRGELRSMPAGDDKLLFFDFSPFEASLPNGYHLRLHIYTLTGSVSNPATWKMTLKGADGIMLLLNPDSRLLSENRESISRLRDLLAAYGVGLNETSAVLQCNDFGVESYVSEPSQIASGLDLADMTACHSNSISGAGLIEALTILSRQILEKVAVQEYPAEIETSPSCYPEETNLLEEAPPPFPLEIDDNSLPDDALKVTVQSQNVVHDAGVVRIPVEIALGDSRRSAVITVAIAIE
ncbi:MAG: hypothetical protein PHU01_14990, partial [Desulfuromonadaceae bacterium]|nr:hypothetical protein [Desulfuromonadaceae bacterium]